MKRLYHVIVPLQHRAYLRNHPLAFWLSFGIALVGFVAFAFPNTITETAVSLALPDWLKHAFYIMFFVGGMVSTYGIVRGKGRLEAAGMILLGTTLLANFLVVVYIKFDAIGQSLFVLTLAIGCFQRGWLLSFGGGYNADEVVALLDRSDVLERLEERLDREE